MLDFESLLHSASTEAFLAKPILSLDGSGRAQGHFSGELPLITEKLKVPDAVGPDWCLGVE